MSKEAMKLALEALKSISEMVDYEGNGFKLEYEIKALEEALAKQEQSEPVFTYEQVKAHIQAAMMSTIPPQRTWVGLTDREKSNLWLESRAAIPRFHTYASLVEAKLKEKNT
jgi:hypothetical protein